jgi:pimeloyl-ACP methyl ester carboxylesterase
VKGRLLRFAGSLAAVPLMLALAACHQWAASASAADLKACPTAEGPADAYCATLDVFEDHASGRRIPLHIVVLPALKQRGARDPLFVLAGGPGEAAAQSAAEAQALFRPLQKTRDIVLVDQRGTGRSNPLVCKNRLAPVDPATAAIARAQACLVELKSRADLTKYTTADAIEDLEAVRRFLGYAEINLYGVSYGTRPAMAYARRYPSVARVIVLDGASPAAMRQPLYAPRDSQRALDRLVADCEKSDRCAARYPNLRQRIQDLFAHLDRQSEPIHYSEPNTGLSSNLVARRRVVAQGLLLALYSSNTAALVPLFIEQAENGDFSGFLAMSAAARVTLDKLAQGAFLSVLCNEDAPGLTSEAIEREAAGTFLGSEPGEQRVAICAQWPRANIATAADAGPSSVPALILSGELDPVSPPSWGEYVVARWKNARHIVVPGSGHQTLTSGCVLTLVARFIDDGDASHVDTSCLAALHRPAFFVNPSGPVERPDTQ